ncbi:HNH endonuclease [Mixta calida]|uniref:HNH endonuclease n=1 Tax=Mixta calida TaxID=665913 RepID=A0ABM6S385_9GAMM|nr:HNH endonuclease [Mixta calida]AUY25596.1 HNH endonuclease [Mixta calida]
MARRSKRKEPEQLRKELLNLIEAFESKLKDDSLREQVLALVPANHTLRDLGGSLIRDEDVHSARDRILAYLKRYSKTLVHGDELMVVAGISEYARRIRELRVQCGWQILSGTVLKQMVDEGDLGLHEIQANSLKDLKTDIYALMSTEEDRDAAHRWNMANDIRKKKVGMKEKIIEYFRRNVGKIVTGEEIAYLANGNSEWARRCRELRTEDGWPIVTKSSGRPDLPVGAYVLEEDKQAEPHDRKIPDKVRIEVLDRDEHSCKICKWNYKDVRPHDRRHLLELHHIKHHAKGGENTAENLITLCNVCHDDIHKRNPAAEELLKLI